MFNSLNKKVTKLESDLKESEEKTERLGAQSRRENLRIYGLPKIRMNHRMIQKIK